MKRAKVRATMPCHWVTDGNGDPVMIPECYGGAHHPSSCTCEVRGSDLDQAKEALREAELRIERMRAASHLKNQRYEQIFNMNRRLRERIAELESQEAKNEVHPILSG